MKSDAPGQATAEVEPRAAQPETVAPTVGVRTATDVPEFGLGLVPRPRLAERLLESPSAHLLLLRAPAGHSKTTCLMEWEAADKRPFAWISADGRHDDPALLVASIVEALDEIELVDPEVLLALSNPHPAIEAVVLPRLARSLAERTKPFVLVIDDLHLITSDISLEVLRTVINDLPQGSQAAFASRSEPSLQLGSLRAKRQLVELRQDELAMTRSESAEVLANIGLELTSDQVSTLFERTEGWPAALYLAGLALLDQPDLDQAVAAFAGDDRIVGDYVRDEFLSALSPARLAFLTRSSILDVLTGPTLRRGAGAAGFRQGARGAAPVELARDPARSHRRPLPLSPPAR